MCETYSGKCPEISLFYWHEGALPKVCFVTDNPLRSDVLLRPGCGSGFLQLTHVDLLRQGRESKKCHAFHSGFKFIGRGIQSLLGRTRNTRPYSISIPNRDSG